MNDSPEPECMSRSQESRSIFHQTFHSGVDPMICKFHLCPGPGLVLRRNGAEKLNKETFVQNQTYGSCRRRIIQLKPTLVSSQTNIFSSMRNFSTFQSFVWIAHSEIPIFILTPWSFLPYEYCMKKKKRKVKSE